ncbi:MAG: ferric iron uptake transcriptional regulator [Gammaproteobacteria bacterium]
MESSELRKRGLKATLPRLKILDILESGEQRHFSAEDVYKSLLLSDEDIGLATVYRVLTQFEAAGLVIRHNFESGHSVFEMSEGDHHDHIVCTQCGKITEFFDETIEKCQEKVAEKSGFKIRDHSLTIYGDCLDENCPNLL